MYIYVACHKHYFILSIMEVQCFLHWPLYSLSGTFHWCPARSMDQCLFSRQQMSRMVLNSHVVVCLFAEHDSPLIGLRNLIMPLRASNLRLVTATCPASIWDVSCLSGSMNLSMLWLWATLTMLRGSGTLWRCCPRSSSSTDLRWAEQTWGRSMWTWVTCVSSCLQKCHL